jgi:hypothetical protein
LHEKPDHEGDCWLNRLIEAKNALEGELNTLEGELNTLATTRAAFRGLLDKEEAQKRREEAVDGK